MLYCAACTALVYQVDVSPPIDNITSDTDTLTIHLYLLVYKGKETMCFNLGQQEIYLVNEGCT